MASEDFGLSFAVTATNATSAVASQSAVAGTTFYITDIAGSSDKAGALLLVKNGTTIVWQVQLGTTAAGMMAFSHSFKRPIRCTTGNLASVTVDGTAACYANIAGYSL